MKDSSLAVEITDLRVDYGNTVAVDSISLSIPQGEIFGLVGPNGAGKTSTFKVLATLLEPTYGSALLFGYDVAENPEEVHQILGYMPDLAPVPSDLKVWEFLDLFAAAYGVHKKQRANRIDQYLREVHLSEQINTYCHTLSRGMKQRLVLAKTLIHHPQLLILDEPASGMDPLSRISLRNTLRELANRGSTVLISSHILTELSDMCTSIGVMSRGRLNTAGKVQEIATEVQQGKRFLDIGLVHNANHDFIEAAFQLLEKNPSITKIERRGHKFHCHFFGDERNQTELLKSLVEAHLPITTMEEVDSNIEDIFFELETREDVQTK